MQISQGFLHVQGQQSTLAALGAGALAFAAAGAAGLTGVPLGVTGVSERLEPVAGAAVVSAAGESVVVESDAPALCKSRTLQQIWLSASNLGRPGMMHRLSQRQASLLSFETEEWPVIPQLGLLGAQQGPNMALKVASFQHTVITQPLHSVSCSIILQWHPTAGFCSQAWELTSHSARVLLATWTWSWREQHPNLWAVSMSPLQMCQHR